MMRLSQDLTHQQIRKAFSFKSTTALFRAVSMLVIALNISGCAEDPTIFPEQDNPEKIARENEKATAACPHKTPLAVLFIGNSYTYGNNLPAMVREIAASFNCKINIKIEGVGGATFAKHLKRPETLSAIQTRQWDSVILQNQSQLPGLRREAVSKRSLPNAIKLADLVKQNNPETDVIFFSTWGRRDGDQHNCSYYPKVCSFNGHTEALIEGYELYRRNTGAKRAPISEAWQRVAQDPNAPLASDTLWAKDGSHASRRGAYLTAAVIYMSATEHYPKYSTYKAGLGSEADYLFSIAESTATAHFLAPPDTSPLQNNASGSAHIEWSKDQ